jgi:hypothetical protein
VISSDLENDFSEYDNIDYWIEDLQLIKVDENILFDSNGRLSDQHLGSAMQILYVKKLKSSGYKQHTYTYAIIRKKCACVKNCLQHIFINNDHSDINKHPHVNIT